jgi:hypothetical protein
VSNLLKVFSSVNNAVMVGTSFAFHAELYLSNKVVTAIFADAKSTGTILVLVWQAVIIITAIEKM